MDEHSLHQETPLTRMKREAGYHAAGMVEDGMVIGLGTGSTTYYAMEHLSALIDEGLPHPGGPDLVPDRDVGPAMLRGSRSPPLDTYPGSTLPSMGQTRSIPPSADQGEGGCTDPREVRGCSSTEPRDRRGRLEMRGHPGGPCPARGDPVRPPARHTRCPGAWQHPGSDRSTERRPGDHRQWKLHPPTARLGPSVNRNVSKGSHPDAGGALLRPLLCIRGKECHRCRSG